jgi:Ca2+-binding EF-hand superfamily protein
MSEVCKNILEEEERLEKEIKELFDKIDTNHSKEIDRKEFRVFANNLYGRSGKKVTQETFDKFFKQLDTDKSGTISLDEFRDYGKKVLRFLSKKN